MTRITEDTHAFLDVAAVDQKRVADILLRVVDHLGLDPHDPYVLTTVTGGFRVSRELYDAAHSPADTPAVERGELERVEDQDDQTAGGQAAGEDSADPDGERGGSPVGAVAESAGAAETVGAVSAAPQRRNRTRKN